MGRPRVILDEEMIEKLAGLHCTMEEIAFASNCSVDTLENRCSEIIKRGRATGRRSLRRMQYESALKGNVVMMIWLGKQLLGQKDISRIELDKVPDDILAQEAERRLKLVNPGA